jgi:hypothetical protein
MIGLRTKYSLAQLLDQQDKTRVIMLVSKHGGRIVIHHGTELYSLVNAVRDLDGGTALAIIKEVVATAGDLRHHVSPKHRFDERLRDLTQCLAMDGYIVDGRTLRQADPSIADAAPIDDDLTQALASSGLRRQADVVAKIEDSAAAYLSPTPDYNASLVNARVALETLAADIALEVAAGTNPLPFDPTKWGQVISYLRQAGEITSEEERGLVGVFALLSAGAHRPIAIGIPETQMTRMGRSFAFNMCWFLLQNRLARRGT